MPSVFLSAVRISMEKETRQNFNQYSTKGNLPPTTRSSSGRRNSQICVTGCEIKVRTKKEKKMGSQKNGFSRRLHSLAYTRMLPSGCSCVRTCVQGPSNGLYKRQNARRQTQFPHCIVRNNSNMKFLVRSSVPHEKKKREKSGNWKTRIMIV